MLTMAVSTTGAKATRSLMKLQLCNCTDSLETFLAKFQRMVRYLQWDAEHKYYHLCTSLEGAASQVLWITDPDALTDIIRLLHTWLVTQLQAEHFKAENLSSSCTKMFVGW